MESLWAQWSYMGDGGSDVGYVSFLAFWFRPSNFDMVVSYMLYGGLVYALWWFGIFFMVVWYMLYGGVVYALWCFDICLDMVFSICFDICIGIWLGICFGISFYDVSICTYVYGCKYRHELCYKAPISSMRLMLLWLCHNVIMLPCSYVIMMLWCCVDWQSTGWSL